MSEIDDSLVDPIATLPYKKLLKLRLDNRVRRFAKLIEINAPAVVVGNELILVIESTVAYFGAGVLTAIGHRIVQDQKGKLGYCMSCEGDTANRLEIGQ